MNAARCVARSERAKYKEGVELLARLALFEHPPGPVFIVFAGQRRIRRGEKERVFSAIFRDFTGIRTNRIDTNSFYPSLLPPPLLF